MAFDGTIAEAESVSLSEIERQIGVRPGQWPTDASRTILRIWLHRQGIPIGETDKSSDFSIRKAYSDSRYLAGWKRRRDQENGTTASDVKAVRDFREKMKREKATRVSNAAASIFDDLADVEEPADVQAQNAILDISENLGTDSSVEKIAEAVDVVIKQKLESLEEGLKAHVANVVSRTRIEFSDEAKREIRSFITDTTKSVLEGLLPKKIQVVRPDATTVNLGVQHKTFETLLLGCSARLPNGFAPNIWLAGPAGSGKTTAASNVAKALGLPFFFNGAIDNEYKLSGFIDAQGRYTSRPFRRAFEEGGVYLFDEVDASLSPALLAFNAATANEWADFPDGIINRHKDCILLAAGNTYGHGANAKYVGRMKQDAALLDRFATLTWETDEELEMQLCPDREWCSYVQRVRANIARQGNMEVIVSPRASFMGASFLAVGMPRELVIQMTLKKGMTQDQWEAVR